MLVGKSYPSDPVITARHKGFPPHTVGRHISDVCGTLSLSEGDFMTPVLFLDERNLRANVKAMQEYCDQAQLWLAPHAKTSMSPEIISRQLMAGAWGMTVANVGQAATVRDMGVDRLIIANELVDPQGITWLGAALDGDDEFTAYCYVDSASGIRAMEETLRARGQRRPLSVFIEYGPRSGRGGVRSAAEALQLADSISECPQLSLAGVAGFEGIVGSGLDRRRLDDVFGYLHGLREVADAVFPHRAADAGEFIATAGGSCFVELVREVLSLEWIGGRPIRTVLRSGCYVTHDSSAYENHRRLVADHFPVVRLVPALELWTRVISRPEPDLAILDVGKRDTGTDAGLPVPRHWLRRGGTVVESAPPLLITALNDQHAYLRSITPNGAMLPVDVGDLIGLGISHPCTTFDKWWLIPVVDQNRTLIGAVQTLF